MFGKYFAIYRNPIRGVDRPSHQAFSWLRFAAALIIFSAVVLLWRNEEVVVDYVRLWNSTTVSIQVNNAKTPVEFPKIGGIPKGKDQYFRLSLEFRASSMDGHPNIFQTSETNDGIRAELDSSGVLGVVVGTDQPQSPASARISNSIKLGQWYNLTIEALNRGFVRVRLEDHDLVSISGSHVAFKTDDFKIGVGFNEERVFRGDISDVRVDVSDVGSFWFGKSIYWSLLIVSVVILGVLISALGSSLRLLARSIWRDDIDRRIAMVSLTLAVWDLLAWSYSSLELPRRLASMLNVHTDILPSRAPLFELSAPFTDFTEISTFPHYVSAVSWASPPAEQLRIMVKQLISAAWPTLWNSGLFFVLFCGLGLAIHIFGMLRLTQGCSP
ncbi:MAG: hypothetical protein P4N59_04265, partial [Negativicutes bacterium]|nr:hypothetical protein [Negativicutes bacterium]